MADNKYGRLFTEADVKEIVALMDPSGFDAGSADAAIKELDENKQTKFPVDEPLFVFRGQDRYALSGIMTYRESCDKAEGVGPEHVAAVDKAVENFRQYATDNYESMKEPD